MRKVPARLLQQFEQCDTLQQHFTYAGSIKVNNILILQSVLISNLNFVCIRTRKCIPCVLSLYTVECLLKQQCGLITNSALMNPEPV